MDVQIEAETPDPMGAYPPYMSPAQVAECIGVDEKQLSQWRYLKIGPPYVKLVPGRSGTVRYSREDVRSFMAARVVDCDPRAVTG
jgi:predicted site-specific integrase-resolvase